jgi:hypothetical protein
LDSVDRRFDALGILIITFRQIVEFIHCPVAHDEDVGRAAGDKGKRKGSGLRRQ